MMTNRIHSGSRSPSQICLIAIGLAAIFAVLYVMHTARSLHNINYRRHLKERLERIEQMKLEAGVIRDEHNRIQAPGFAPQESQAQAPVRTLRQVVVEAQCVPSKRPSAIVQQSIRSIAADDKDGKCKEQLITAACHLQRGTLYPKLLTKECPKDDSEDINLSSKSVVPKFLFIIDVNSGDARQVQRLLINIFSKSDYYLLIISKCLEGLTDSLKRLTKETSNIRLLYYKSWCRSTLSDPDHESMPQTLSFWREMLAATDDWSWSHLMTLDAYDFPLIAIDQLRDRVQSSPTSIFLESYRLQPDSDRLRNLSIECDQDGGVRVPIGDDAPPDGIDYYLGPAWFLLTRQFAQQALVEKETEKFSLTEGLRRFAEVTARPVPLLLHTLSRNGRFCAHATNDSLRFTKYHLFHRLSAQNLPVNDPQLLRWTLLPGDFGHLMAENGSAFARKIDPSISQQVYYDLESGLLPQRRQRRQRDRTGTTEVNVQTPQLHTHWRTLWTGREGQPETSSSARRYAVLAQLLGDLCQRRMSRCADLRPRLTLDRLTLYRYFDVDDGLVLTMNVSCGGNSTVSVECYAGFLRHQHAEYNEGEDTDAVWPNRLIDLRVGSDYDRLERSFRNYAGNVVLPDEQFGLLSEWTKGDVTSTYQLALVDSTDIVRATTTMTVRPETETHFQPKPDAANQLPPGVWTAALVRQGVILGTAEFLLLPGSVEKYSTIDQKDRLRYGRRFFRVQRLCISELTSGQFRKCRCSAPEVPVCETTGWSTLADDPKSDFVRFLHRQPRQRRRVFWPVVNEVARKT